MWSASARVANGPRRTLNAPAVCVTNAVKPADCSLETCDSATPFELNEPVCTSIVPLAEAAGAAAGAGAGLAGALVTAGFSGAFSGCFVVAGGSAGLVAGVEAALEAAGVAAGSADFEF